MRRQLLLIIIMAFSLHSVMHAQGWERTGRRFWDAIPVTFDSGQSTFTDTRNTKDYYMYSSYEYHSPQTEEYLRTRGRAVFYEMKTTAPGDIRINNWWSTAEYTTLFLVAPNDPSQEPGESFDCDSVYIIDAIYEGDCADMEIPEERPQDVSWGQAYIYVPDLPAGTYYIIAAGYQYSNGSVSNGDIRTNITAIFEPIIPGEPSIEPERPNTCPVQYQYDTSGNRTKTIKK